MARHVQKLSHSIPRTEKPGYKVKNHDFISISSKIMSFIVSDSNDFQLITLKLR